MHQVHAGLLLIDFCANARTMNHLSKAGVLPLCLSDSQCAVIMSGDKATNKPKLSESITDFHVLNDAAIDYSGAEGDHREMEGQLSDYVMNCFVLL